MTVAEQKRQWFEDRRRELHERGLRDTDIAEQMGIGRSYFSRVVKAASVGDAFIDSMCKSFGFKFSTGQPVENSLNDKGGLTERTAQDMVSRVMDTLQRQTETIDTLTRLLKLALDRLEENGRKLDQMAEEPRKGLRASPTHTHGR